MRLATPLLVGMPLLMGTHATGADATAWELRLAAGIAPGIQRLESAGAAQELDPVYGFDVQLALLASLPLGDRGWSLVGGPGLAARTVGGSETTPAARTDVTLSALALRFAIGPAFTWEGWRWEATPVLELGAALGEVRRTPGATADGGTGGYVGGGLSTAVAYAIDADWTIGVALGLQAFRADLDFAASTAAPRAESSVAGSGVHLALTAGWDF